MKKRKNSAELTTSEEMPIGRELLNTRTRFSKRMPVSDTNLEMLLKTSTTNASNRGFKTKRRD